jgi:hypothetical protein
VGKRHSRRRNITATQTRESVPVRHLRAAAGGARGERGTPGSAAPGHTPARRHRRQPGPAHHRSAPRRCAGRHHRPRRPRRRPPGLRRRTRRGHGDRVAGRVGTPRRSRTTRYLRLDLDQRSAPLVLPRTRSPKVAGPGTKTHPQHRTRRQDADRHEVQRRLPRSIICETPNTSSGTTRRRHFKHIRFN